MPSHRHVKNGCNPSTPKKLARELKVAHYLGAAAFAEFIPPVFRLQQGVPQCMDLNDKLGCCVVATMAKMVRCWTQTATGVAATITDADVEDVYRKGAGYNPAKPSTDNGWDLLSQLKYWQRTGIAGHKIGAYANVNPKHEFMMRAACYLFEGLDVALALPLSAQDQEIWDVVDGSSGAAWTWGGHAAPLLGFDADGYGLIETWGMEQRCTPTFLRKYCFEAHCIISPDALDGSGKVIAGLDVDALTADLVLVTA